MQRVGSMLAPFFSSSPMSWDDAAKCDTAKFGLFHRALLLKEGVYWPLLFSTEGWVRLSHDERGAPACRRALRSAFPSDLSLGNDEEQIARPCRTRAWTPRRGCAR